jgi:hypothetical protein
MLPHAGNLLRQALHLAIGYMGTSALAVGAGLAFFLIREGCVLYRDGWTAVRDRWKGDAGIGLLLTVALWACLFLWCVADAVYIDHSTLITANAMVRAERDQLKAKADTEEQEIERLKKAPPKIVYTAPPANGALDGEAAKKRLELRTQLSTSVNEATGIMNACLHPPPSVAPAQADASCEKAATDWDEKTARYIHSNMEPSYLTRFNSADSDMPSMSWNGADQNVNRDLNYLNSRIVALKQFIKEMLN